MNRYFLLSLLLLLFTSIFLSAFLGYRYLQSKQTISYLNSLLTNSPKTPSPQQNEETLSFKQRSYFVDDILPKYPQFQSILSPYVIRRVLPFTEDDSNQDQDWLVEVIPASQSANINLNLTRSTSEYRSLYLLQTLKSKITLLTPTPDYCYVERVAPIFHKATRYTDLPYYANQQNETVTDLENRLFISSVCSGNDDQVSMFDLDGKKISFSTPSRYNRYYLVKQGNALGKIKSISSTKVFIEYLNGVASFSTRTGVLKDFFSYSEE